MPSCACSGEVDLADSAKEKGAPASAKASLSSSELWSNLPLSKEEFCLKIQEQGTRLYRSLPWRNLDSPYAVLVSEVMLQQTQVTRVEKYWQRWMQLFPTVDALAAADTSMVLSEWQGLGYNRRALALKRACEQCSQELDGQLPLRAEELQELPGIGPATAAGVVAFAYNQPSTYLETNVRTVFLHELFPDRDQVSDKELLPLVEDACPKADARLVSASGMAQMDPRAWYYALLDYGAYLKKTVPNPSRRSKQHARQSAFEGSRRQKRAALLRIVLGEGSISVVDAAASLDAAELAAGRVPVEAKEFEGILNDLVGEGFFACCGDTLMCE